MPAQAAVVDVAQAFAQGPVTICVVPQRQPERDVAVALTNLERRELDAVVQALSRLEAGRYGRCARCGVDIPFDRLRAEPWALHCVSCAA